MTLDIGDGASCSVSSGKILSKKCQKRLRTKIRTMEEGQNRAQADDKRLWAAGSLAPVDLNCFCEGVCTAQCLFYDGVCTSGHPQRVAITRAGSTEVLHCAWNKESSWCHALLEAHPLIRVAVMLEMLCLLLWENRRGWSTG